MRRWDSVIEVTNHDVDVTSMWRRTTSKYRRSASVDKNVADPKGRRVEDRISVWSTDKLNGVTDLQMDDFIFYQFKLLLSLKINLESFIRF